VIEGLKQREASDRILSHTREKAAAARVADQVLQTLRAKVTQVRLRERERERDRDREREIDGHLRRAGGNGRADTT
jgi:hypothetical protein